MQPVLFERILKIIFSVIVIVVLTLMMMKYAALVIYALIAVLLSYIIEPLVNKLQTKGLNRIWSIIISMSVFLLFIVWASTSIFPVFINQIFTLAQQLDARNVQSIVTKIETQIAAYIPVLPDGFLRETSTNLLSKIFEISGIQETFSKILSVFTNVFYAVIIIPLSTFFFLKDGSAFRRNILEWIPNAYFELSLSILSKIEYRLVQYFKSVALQSLFVSLLVWFLLTIFGFENSMAIAVFCGVANTIPYFGPLLGYLLAIIVAIFETGNFDLVGWGVLALFITHLIDNIVFQPVLFSKSADLHPIIILFTVLIGAETAGIIGMLIAIPIATTIKILFREISKSISNYHVFRLRRT